MSNDLEDAREGVGADEAPSTRRDVLRAAGLATLAVVAAPTPAGAATGDPVVAGGDTTASPGDSTGLLSTTRGRPVLQLTNQQPPGEGAQPILRLASASAGESAGMLGSRGDLAVTDGRYLSFAHEGQNEGRKVAVWGRVFTSAFATYTHMLDTPVRALDTRHGIGGLSRKMNAGEEYRLDLARLVAEERAIAVLVNATVTAPDGAGFLALYPRRPEPMTSTLNFTRGATVANFAVTRLPLHIFVSATTHVILDVVGFVVNDVGVVRV